MKKTMLALSLAAAATLSIGAIAHPEDGQRGPRGPQAMQGGGPGAGHGHGMHGNAGEGHRHGMRGGGHGMHGRGQGMQDRQAMHERMHGGQGAPRGPGAGVPSSPPAN